MAEAKKPQAVYQPGELARTRENLGVLSAEEAKNLAKKLGGVVGVEKTAPVDTEALKKIKKQQPIARPGGKGAGSKGAKQQSASSASQTPPRVVTRRELLPRLTQREKNKMDSLMMSSEYQIKQDFGIFNFFYFLFKNRSNIVLNSFAKRTLQRHINHLQSFNEAVFNILKLSPDTYKQKIMNPSELHLKLLKKLANWPKMLNEVKTQYRNIAASDIPVTIEALIPLTCAFYKMLLQIYYLGEMRTTSLFKSVFEDLASYPDARKRELAACMKNVIAELPYIYGKITEGMYPLLMRMCVTQCMDHDEFFITEIGQILPFLEVTKFDILLPEKKREGPQDVVRNENERRESEETMQTEKEEKAREEAKRRRERFKITETGLKLLDVMFPGAQWLSLSLGTDMFAYFQPIYQFPDGVNLLAPQNPLQVLVVLLRILEDFIRGCRNITFELPAELAQRHNDTFSAAMTEWMSYREVLFEKNYSTDLKDYVNNLYSKSDFAHSPIGKKLIFNLMWQTKNYFLPFFKIDSLSLERPAREVTLKQLSPRVTFLRDVFAELAVKIDGAIQNRSEIPEIPNAWEKYKFDIDNAVSRRLDALLGAKRNSPMAVNASIVKYTASVLAVLDWWINDEASPARDQENFKLFRTSPVDGRPAFSTDLRTDTEQLFKQNLKKLAEQAAGQKQKTEGNASAGGARGGEQGADAPNAENAQQTQSGSPQPDAEQPAETQATTEEASVAQPVSVNGTSAEFEAAGEELAH
jgi:hypothetical protein